MLHQKFSERFKLYKLYNNVSKTEYFMLKDLKTRNYCYFTLNNREKTLKEVAKAYNNGVFIPYSIMTREQTKVIDIFADKETIKYCRHYLKLLYPPTKYLKGHRYTNKQREIAKVIAVNINLKKIHGKIIHSEIFKCDLVDKEEFITTYREIYGDAKMNIEGACM